MSGTYLEVEGLPFCRGCGHHLVARNLDAALARLPGLRPCDVVVVTDIGCLGIIDKQFRAHTVHGLHGRSVALATGIALGLADASKKVIVMIGDGGATIGLHHLLEAAQRNVDITVVVHNNMVYGMTGGQPSGLTPAGFKTPITPDGTTRGGYDLCQLMSDAGAPHVSRLLAAGDFADALAAALAVRGFSLVEVMELCPSYGYRYNPGKKLGDVVAASDLEVRQWRGAAREVFAPEMRPSPPSLFDQEPIVERAFSSDLDRPFGLVLGGSAGEGVQSAAEFLARAAMACGLSVTKKGSYPVTVGVGFSVAELLLSPHPIVFASQPEPDAVIVSSEEGMAKLAPVIASMTTGSVFLDATLEPPPSGARVFRHDFRRAPGARNAALVSVLHFLNRQPILPTAALIATVRGSRIGRKADLEGMLAMAE